MYYDVTEAKYVGDYRLEITFENGKSGMVDFRKFIDRGGVLPGWRPRTIFGNLRLTGNWGVIT